MKASAGLLVLFPSPHLFPEKGESGVHSPEELLMLFISAQKKNIADSKEIFDSKVKVGSAVNYNTDKGSLDKLIQTLKGDFEARKKKINQRI